MLEIYTNESHWRRNLVVFIIFLLLAAGGYIIVNVLTPGIDDPILTGKTPHATEQKLESPPGANGDRLYLPQINVDVPITPGQEALLKGAWHRKPENGDPIQGGNFVLSAHRFVMDLTPQGTAEKSPFYNLDRLAVGDQFYVDYQNKRFKYEISRKYSVASEAAEIENRTVDAKLTLYSCTLEGSADGREVVEAKQLPGFRTADN
jgi:sortase A